MNQDDKALISRILDGDVRCYAVLVDRHKDLAFTLAYRILCNREDAEETVQDSFVKAYHHLSGFRHDSKFSSWLFRIVYNAAVSRKRLKKHSTLSLNDLPASGDALFAEQEVEIPEEKGYILENAMKQLPDDERVLITLFYLHESTVEEIHGITGLSKPNVKVKLFRARKKLREVMELMAERIYV